MEKTGKQISLRRIEKTIDVKAEVTAGGRLLQRQHLATRKARYLTVDSLCIIWLSIYNKVQIIGI